MSRYEVKKRALVTSLILAGAMISPAFAFTSGSTGADGAFSPTVNTALQLPPSGIFNFTTVNIPSGVTVTFVRNTTNTPVVMLASGNVTIAGTMNVSGSNATNSGTGGDGNLGDDGIPGAGGPGGYDGGAGGNVGPLSATGSNPGGNGRGPGGGTRGYSYSYYGTQTVGFGAGGGFGAAGSNGSGGFPGGPAYGSSLLLPLVGGSGGGGGGGGTSYMGSGGGGGGGTLLIACDGTVNVTGSILANGGASGDAGTGTPGHGDSGGGGSGGAIRIVATTLSGNGTLSATGGGAANGNGGVGAVGRIRLEASTMQRTAATNPAYTFAAPGSVFVAGLPTLTITSVAGVAAPAAPTGNADITLPSTTSNPVTVAFATTGVPVGNTVSLTVTPANGTPVTVVSPALAGTPDPATATVSVNLPSGPSVLQATVSYTVTASVGDLLGTQFAKGERVEKVTLVAGLKGLTMMTLTTVSGKTYTVPSTQVAGIVGS